MSRQLRVYLVSCKPRLQVLWLDGFFHGDSDSESLDGPRAPVRSRLERAGLVLLKALWPHVSLSGSVLLQGGRFSDTP